MAARILIVNGWSNSGKTCFTRWLSKEHGFDRVDTDEGEIDTKHLRPFWTKVEQGDATAFKQALHNRAKDTVLDWPYNPPDSFPLVAACRKPASPSGGSTLTLKRPRSRSTSGRRASWRTRRKEFPRTSRCTGQPTSSGTPGSDTCTENATYERFMLAVLVHRKSRSGLRSAQGRDGTRRPVLSGGD